MDDKNVKSTYGGEYKRNIILTDFQPDGDFSFKTGVEKVTCREWEVIGDKSNYLFGSFFAKLKRYFHYFIFPLSLFFRRKKFNAIISWQQFYGLIYAFYSRLFHVKKRHPLIVMTFIYKDKGGALGKIYKRFMSYIVTSKYIDKFIVFNSKECVYYSNLFKVPFEKFVFLPLGVEDVSERFSIEKGGRLLSVGRSNRDYDFLISALQGTEYQIDILCDNLHVDTTDKIKIYTDKHGDDYFEILSKCFCVIIPLKDINISSGQLVITQAMMMGKPIIITDVPSVYDYVENEKTALCIKNNKKELIEAIEKLKSDDKLYNLLSTNEREKFNSMGTNYDLGESVGKLLSHCI